MRYSLPFAVLAAAAAALAGCHEDGGLNIAFTFGVHKASATACKKSEPSAAAKTPCGMTKFRLCAGSIAEQAVICGDYDAAAGEAGVELEVPEGEYTLSFQGYDGDSKDLVVWCGKAQGVKVSPGASTSASMFVARCSDFVFARGKMKTARAFHVAAPLPDGKVLVAGGVPQAGSSVSCDDACKDFKGGKFVDGAGKECTPGCSVVDAIGGAEIYDPAAGTFAAAPGNMVAPRAFATATALPDGKVVIAGGAEQVRVYRFPGGGTPIFLPHTFGDAGDSAEIFDPSSGKFTIKAGASERRAMHAAVATKGGKVAIVGGISAEGAPTPAETVAVGDAGGFKGGTQLQTPRAWPIAVDYAGDSAASSVLVWGGNTPGSDKGDDLGPAGNYAETWEEGGASGSTNRPGLLADKGSGLPQFCHAAALLQDLRVVVAGGMYASDFVDDKGALTPAATPLKDVRIVDLAGESGVLVPSGEAYELRYPRALHTMTPLIDGRILVAGGFSSRAPSCETPVCFIPTDSIEVFVPISEIFDTLHPQGTGGSFVTLGTPRAGHTAVPLQDGTVLVAGGMSSGLDFDDTAEIFSPYPNILMEY